MKCKKLNFLFIFVQLFSLTHILLSLPPCNDDVKVITSPTLSLAEEAYLNHFYPLTQKATYQFMNKYFSSTSTTPIYKENLEYNDTLPSAPPLEEDSFPDTSTFSTPTFNYSHYYSNQQELPKMPNIAFCFSGGGYRALICTLATLYASHEVGLLPAIRHISTLSGSTWFLATWLLLQQPINKMLENIENIIVKQKFYNLDMEDIDAITETLLKKLENKQKLYPVDLWGAILADRLWKNFCDAKQAQKLTFSNIQKALANQNNNFYYPYPLFTTITYNTDPYTWITVDPFFTEIIDPAYHENDSRIDTQYFGCKFYNRSMRSSIFPPNSLGYFMGLFGSAYSFSIAEILNIIDEKIDPSHKFYHILQEIIKNLDLYKEHILPTYINNFLYKIPQFKLHKFKTLGCADAGMAFNLPIPPLLKKSRKVDIIIICDSSNAKQDNFFELYRAEEYAKQRNIPFPDIKKDKKQITDCLYIFEKNKKIMTCSNFCTKEIPIPGVPTIIYITNPISFSTLKFDYTKEEFNKLFNGINNILCNPVNLKAIATAIKRKQSLLNKELNNNELDKSFPEYESNININTMLSDLFAINNFLPFCTSQHNFLKKEKLRELNKDLIKRLKKYNHIRLKETDNGLISAFKHWLF